MSSASQTDDIQVATGQAPRQYSTNPSTIKARRRKMELTGAKKIEDQARTADYKAMIYARNVAREKTEFKNATTEAERSAILETAMRDTMEKRRSKGQDTMSKMAAYNSGRTSLRSGSGGPQSTVPISSFLERNGYVPPPAGRADQQQGRHLTAGMGNGPAPIANMNTPNDLDPSRQGSAPVFSLNGRLVNGGGQPVPHRSSIFVSNVAPISAEEDVKPSDSPAPFRNMTPEPGMMPSIEGDGSSDELMDMRRELSQLRSMLQNTMASNNINYDLHSFRTELGADQSKVSDLEARMSRIEKVVQTMESVSMATVIERVGLVEQAISELKAKVGEGCDAEVAKMREVFGSLREALERVGRFL